MMVLIRQSCSLLVRAARTPVPSSSYAIAAPSMARRSYARHYSEASASSMTESEGAEAASSAKLDQNSDVAIGKGKGPDDVTQKIEAKDKEIARLKVELRIRFALIDLSEQLFFVGQLVAEQGRIRQFPEIDSARKAEC